ncbi:MAG: hypothetical protein IKR46_00305 [Clostridia bacterium]|nr:hypothetical protein [Clostridia bacterium]
MKKVKISKTLLKVLSTIIAIVLWFAITYTEDPAISQTITGVKLVVKGEDSLNSGGFAIVNKDSFPPLNVTIRGNRSNVISALGEIYAEIDVSSIKQAGTSVVAVSYSYPSSRVMLVKTKVKEITVETEAVVAREIPVKTEVVNRDKNSDFLVKSECKTETVSVRGAESDVYKIAYAKTKIDTTNVTKTSEMECPYEFYDENDNVVSDENLIYKSRETVSVENTVYEKVSLPIKVVLSAEKRREYGVLVKNMSAAVVEVGIDEGFSAEFIEAEISAEKDKNGYEATLVAPEGVYIPEESVKIMVNGEIVPKETKEVTVTIEPINVPIGTNVTVSPTERTITVKTAGDSEEIELKATVDVSKMTEAEALLPILVEAYGDADIVGTYSVTVKTEQGE